ncbi:MAG: hypothetical protein ACOYK8_07220 [Alphaproteobacteria bacterium]
MADVELYDGGDALVYWLSNSFIFNIYQAKEKDSIHILSEAPFIDENVTASLSDRFNNANPVASIIAQIGDALGRVEGVAAVEILVDKESGEHFRGFKLQTTEDFQLVAMLQSLQTITDTTRTLGKNQDTPLLSDAVIEEVAKAQIIEARPDFARNHLKTRPIYPLPMLQSLQTITDTAGPFRKMKGPHF